MITAETVRHRSRATNAAAVDAAGIQKLNMLHILSTNAWAKPQDPAALVRAPSSKLQACEVTSFKLDRSSSLGYHRINGKVQHLERFVGPSHITNRRHAHLVRSSTRAARKYPGLPVDSNVIMVMERPGDRDPEPQAPRGKVQASSFKPKLQAQKFSG